MPTTRELDSSRITALLVFSSAALWVGSSAANRYFLSFAGFAPGIDLIYLPAGVRLLIVLLFGVWGALGISLVNPLLYFVEFGTGSTTQVIVNSLICGFAPFLTVKAFCRLAGIQASLLQLKPIHLPLLALAVSIVTPALLYLYFEAAGLNNTSGFRLNFTAMATGDFLGCLLLIVLVRIGIAAFRRLAAADL